MYVLGDISDAVGNVVGCPARHTDISVVGFQQAKHQLQKGRFATAIGSDQDGKITGFDVHVDIFQHRFPVVGETKVFNRDGGCWPVGCDPIAGWVDWVMGCCHRKAALI